MLLDRLLAITPLSLTTVGATARCCLAVMTETTSLAIPGNGMERRGLWSHQYPAKSSLTTSTKQLPREVVMRVLGLLMVFVFSSLLVAFHFLSSAAAHRWLTRR